MDKKKSNKFGTPYISNDLLRKLDPSNRYTFKTDKDVWHPEHLKPASELFRSNYDDIFRQPKTLKDVMDDVPPMKGITLGHHTDHDN